MKDLKIETESPLSIAGQIEVLELAKAKINRQVERYKCEGLCTILLESCFQLHSYKAEFVPLSILIPSFNYGYAVFSNTYAFLYQDEYNTKYWWNVRVSEGGITKRLAFLDWFIERLKADERENAKRTTTE